ncbi:MAG: thiamine pyrophosphate-dependent enzyme, partial [Pseudomonadota bacterium]
CDWSETARSAEAAFALIDRAFTEFELKRPRPKHLSVPIPLLEAPAARPATPGRVASPASERAEGNAVVEIAACVMAASRPVVVFGGGVARSPGADRAARRVLARTKAASFMTYAGRGIALPDDPLSFGSALARPESAELLASSDFVLILGTDLSEGDLWRAEAGHAPGAVIVNIDAQVLAAVRPGDVGIKADAAGFLTDLERALEGLDPMSRWQPEEIARYRALWRHAVEAERPGILRVAEAIKAALPKDTMIYSDMTQFAYSAKECWDMPLPGHWHHPTGFGTLGYALPAAIGGAVARLGAPTLAIAGDYGFQYTLQELGTAIELGLSLPIIIWDNGALKEIEDGMIAAQISPNAVTARNPDFVALARAYGANGIAPKTLGEMQGALRAALKAPAPTLIHLTPEIG